MLAILEKTAVRQRAYPVSVAAYQALGATGEIAENVELIRGAIIEKMPKSPLHSSIVQLLVEGVRLVLPAGFIVRQEQPITGTDSEPEPDVAVVHGTVQDFTQAHPRGAELVVEVAVSSEEIDREKANIYAELGVAEFWLVLATGRMIEIHTEPAGGSYRKMVRVQAGEWAQSSTLPALRIAVGPLFGV